MKINDEKLAVKLTEMCKGFMYQVETAGYGENAKTYIQRTFQGGRYLVAEITKNGTNFNKPAFDKLPHLEKLLMKEIVYRHISDSYCVSGRAKPYWTSTGTDWADTFLCQDVVTGEYSYSSTSVLKKDSEKVKTVFTESELRVIESNLDVPSGTHYIEKVRTLGEHK